MKNPKKRGSDVERELLHLLWEKGYAALRIAGSGSMHYDAADIVASDGKNIFVIEIKLMDKTKYIRNSQVKELRNLANRFNAFPIIALKVKRKGWFFIKPEDMEKKGKNFFISFEMLRMLNRKFFKKIHG